MSSAGDGDRQAWRQGSGKTLKNPKTLRDGTKQRVSDAECVGNAVALCCVGVDACGLGAPWLR